MTQAEPGLPRQSFNSADGDPAQAFAGWQAAVAPVFDVAPAFPDQPFAATYDSYHLGDILIGLGTFDATAFTRSLDKAKRDGLDYVLIQVYTAGGYSGHLDDRPVTVHPRDLVTLDMTRETRTVSLASSNITVLLPRDLVKSRQIPHGLMTRGPRGAVLGGMLADHLIGLSQRLHTMPLSTGAAAAVATLALYEAALDPIEEMLEAAVEPQRDLLFQRVRRLIDARITSGKIDIASLAADLGVSRSTLYRLFEPQKGVEAYITDRRLAHVRRALSDENDTRRIGTIAAAYGFDDHSNFSRIFKRRYGQTPADLRTLGRHARPEENEESFDLRPWIADVT
ncbi:MAG: helix-turn-helix domain-containing protein [Alphaproteobacteria bacterium]|nr:helix-turn-helix domain-containing protein [Alphaproteobacteria bacterium]